MVPAVILSAGLSTRMGRTKATLPLGPGETFLTRVIRTFLAAGVADIVVVLGHDADRIELCLNEHGLAPRLVLNPGYQSGQLSSVLSGLNAVDRPGVSGMLLTLVDVPLVSESTVRAVLGRYHRTGARIVRPVRGGAHGHPVLIDRSLFGAIRAADPSQGMKPVVRAHVSSTGDLGVDDEGAFFDVDTPSEYERILDRVRSP